MAPDAESSFAALELRDRAFHFVAERGPVSEDEVLAHVYGGPPPNALRARLSAPLLADERITRLPDGTWSVQSTPMPSVSLAFTALAIAASGARPDRARVFRVVALHVVDGEIVERFDATLNPECRVPRYALERAGLEVEALETQPRFNAVVDDVQSFLANRPILAQDVHLTWDFLTDEARRCERILIEPTLIDLNALASARLDLKGKPSLSVVAAQLGVGSVRITHVDEEARVLAIVGSRLLADGLPEARSDVGPVSALRRGATVQTLPDEPGVYVLRDQSQTPLYVGKARRLRSRVAAYVHRPLGATRRLEGLVGSVAAVDTTQCETELEALILEDRSIRGLQPRFNTVRRQRTPRYWIRRPAERVLKSGRMGAPPRLELSTGPDTAAGEFVGPFRNEMLAEQARLLAREVFELDSARRDDAWTYPERLSEAWQFLRGDSSGAERRARSRSVTLLRKVLAFDVVALLLPADPRHARFAVVRPGPMGIEGFVLDHARLVAFARLEEDDAFAFARALLESRQPRTEPEDSDVVLRWFGAQRPPARLLCLSDDALIDADAIEGAALDLRFAEP